jgi:hypothetical protein
MSEFMHVYFDSVGDIKSISPDELSDCDDFSVTMLPLHEVMDFLTGKKSTQNFFVKIVKKLNEVTYSIKVKDSGIQGYKRTSSQYLTEGVKNIDPIVIIDNDTIRKIISIKIATIDTNAADIELVTQFLQSASSLLFFTKKNDPHFLVHTIAFSPTELHKTKILTISYTANLDDVSMYTQQLVNRYSYISRGKEEFNTLNTQIYSGAPAQYLIECIKKENPSIIIENQMYNNAIRIDYAFSNGSSSELNEFMHSKSSFLFFTKKKDPHFLVHIIPFSPIELYREKTIFIPYTINLSDVSVYTPISAVNYSYVATRNKNDI